jgi:biopolymer transport protein TolR
VEEVVMKETTGRPLKAEINITPLVDVVLVLLIIFMVVTPLLMDRGVPVLLPLADEPPQKEDDRREVIVSVTDETKIYIENQAVSKNELVRRLQELQQAVPDRPLLLRGDCRLRYGQMKEVMALITQAGFTNVALMAQKRDIQAVR